MPEIFSDLKFWTFIFAVLCAFISAIGGSINWLASQKLGNNHMAHLDEKIDKVITSQGETKKSLSELKIDVAILKEKTKNF